MDDPIFIPDFMGDHYVEFMDGSHRQLSLIGAIYDPSNRPIYLKDVEGFVYNFNNVISVKRRSRNG